MRRASGGQCSLESPITPSDGGGRRQSQMTQGGLVEAGPQSGFDEAAQQRTHGEDPCLSLQLGWSPQEGQSAADFGVCLHTQRFLKQRVVCRAKARKPPVL